MLYQNTKMFGKLFLTGVLVAFTGQVFGVRLIDLTHNLNEKSITWPVNPRFKLDIMHRGPYQGTTVWVENNNISLAEHTGTHVDAPVHFGKGKWRVHQVPLDRLYGPGVVINVKDKVKDNSNYQVSIDDIEKWEMKHGKIPSGAVVFMNSGWDVKQGNYELAYGSKDPVDLTSHRFPGWHKDAVKWLIDKRGLKVLGADTPSFENGQAPKEMFPVHQLISANSICGVENAANLDKIPESGSVIYIPIVKIEEGSGAPARIFAIVDHDENIATPTISNLLLLISTVLFAWTWIV